MAVLFAFFQGLVMDMYSGSIYGLFSFVYLCVYIFIYISSRFIDIHKRTGYISLIFLAMLLKDMLLLLITQIFYKGIPMSMSFLSDLLFCVILTVFIGPAIFKMLNRLSHDKIV